MFEETGFQKRSKKRAALAQLVEHLICNQGVGGSSPSGGTNLFNKLSQSPRRVRFQIGSNNPNPVGSRSKKAASSLLGESFATKQSRAAIAGVFALSVRTQPFSLTMTTRQVLMPT